MRAASALFLTFFFALQLNGQNTVERIEYWFNDDFAGRIAIPATVQENLNLNTVIQTGSLSTGLNLFNLRTRDNNGVFSSTISQSFYKIPGTVMAIPAISEYRYWFDNDLTGATGIDHNNVEQLSLSQLLSVSSLTDGIHVFNIRFKDNQGLWSQVMSHVFYKIPAHSVTDKVISACRYWLDDDFDNAVYITLQTPVKNITLIEDLDFRSLPKGQHAINFQFREVTGVWSVVTTDVFEKRAKPYSDFTFVANAGCEKTAVSFVNKSVDSHEYSWDFGDSTTDTARNPSHEYIIPGMYTVILTVTDTVTLEQSTSQTDIHITGNTYHSYNVVTCDSYTLPGGSRTVTETGIYKDTIANHWGCDSIITVDVTINRSPDKGVTVSGTTLTAVATGATYNWLDCNNEHNPVPGANERSYTATQNGSYAAEISRDGCTVITDCYAITTVDITETGFGNETLPYPNPTDGRIYIYLNEEYPEITVTLSTTDGRVIRSVVLHDTNIIEMFLNEPPGLYLLSLRSGKKHAIYKVVKK